MRTIDGWRQTGKEVVVVEPKVEEGVHSCRCCCCGCGCCCCLLLRRRLRSSRGGCALVLLLFLPLIKLCDLLGACGCSDGLASQPRRGAVPLLPLVVVPFLLLFVFYTPVFALLWYNGFYLYLCRICASLLAATVLLFRKDGFRCDWCCVHNPLGCKRIAPLFVNPYDLLLHGWRRGEGRR